MVKNCLPMQKISEMWVRSLGWKNPLEEGIATHSSILAWEIPWTEESGRLNSMGSHRVGHDLNNLTHMFCNYKIVAVISNFHYRK